MRRDRRRPLLAPPPPAYLSVLRGDLEEQRQTAVVKVVVQGHQGAVHAALQQDVGVVPQADALHPADDPLVAPRQHVCGGPGPHLLLAKGALGGAAACRRRLTSDLVLTVLPAPLQLLPVVVELLQTHDSVL